MNAQHNLLLRNNVRQKSNDKRTLKLFSPHLLRPSDINLTLTPLGARHMQIAHVQFSRARRVITPKPSRSAAETPMRSTHTSLCDTFGQENSAAPPVVVYFFLVKLIRKLFKKNIFKGNAEQYFFFYVMQCLKRKGKKKEFPAVEWDPLDETQPNSPFW